MVNVLIRVHRSSSLNERDGAVLFLPEVYFPGSTMSLLNHRVQATLSNKICEMCFSESCGYKESLSGLVQSRVWSREGHVIDATRLGNI